MYDVKKTREIIREPVETFILGKWQGSVNTYNGKQKLKMWISRIHSQRFHFRKSVLGARNLTFNNADSDSK